MSGVNLKCFEPIVEEGSVKEDDVRLISTFFQGPSTAQKRDGVSHLGLRNNVEFPDRSNEQRRREKRKSVVNKVG